MYGEKEGARIYYPIIMKPFRKKIRVRTEITQFDKGYVQEM